MAAKAPSTLRLEKSSLFIPAMSAVYPLNAYVYVSLINFFRTAHFWLLHRLIREPTLVFGDERFFAYLRTCNIFVAVRYRKLQFLLLYHCK